MSAIVTTLATVTSVAERAIIGPTTLPPSSTKCATPVSFIAIALSRQRTRPVTCSTSSRWTSAGSAVIAAVTLANSGRRSAPGGVLASASAIASAAGAISGQWNGAETGSGMPRLMPCSLTSAIARSIAALWPESTT